MVKDESHQMTDEFLAPKSREPLTYVLEADRTLPVEYKSHKKSVWQADYSHCPNKYHFVLASLRLVLVDLGRSEVCTF